MNNIKRLLAVAAVSALLTACGGSQSNPPGVTTQNPGAPGYAKLQMAVGTLTVAGPTGTVIGTGVNLVSTLRQPNGKTAVLVDTPTFTGPFALATAFSTTAGTAGPGNSGSSSNAFSVDTYSTVPAPANMGASTVPAGTVTGGPSPSDIGSNSLNGTTQTLHPGAPVCDLNGTAPAGYTACSPGVSPDSTTFGQSGGVFGMGLQPANATTNAVPLTFMPYPVPFFAACAAPPAGCASAQNIGVPPAVAVATNQMLPWGGPPAFDPDHDNMGARDGQFFVQGIQGVVEGITAFQFPAGTTIAGPYSLNVQIPTGLNNQGQSGFTTVSATASITSTAGLPALTTPTFTTDGAGGGSITLPAADFAGGISEIYIEIVDLGPSGALGTVNCQGAKYGTAVRPVYYTIVAHSTDASFTYTLPDTDGPNVNQSSATAQTPSPSICTGAQNTAALGAPTLGDVYSVQLLGMDYPLYEASYPNNNQQTPTITGPSGQSDLTMSYPMTFTSP